MVYLIVFRREQKDKKTAQLSSVEHLFVTPLRSYRNSACAALDCLVCTFMFFYSRLDIHHIWRSESINVKSKHTCKHDYRGRKVTNLKNKCQQSELYKRCSFSLCHQNCFMVKMTSETSPLHIFNMWETDVSSQPFLSWWQDASGWHQFNSRQLLR